MEGNMNKLDYGIFGSKRCKSLMKNIESDHEVDLSLLLDEDYLFVQCENLK